MCAESFRGRCCLQGVRAAVRSQPLAKSRPSSSCEKHCHKLNKSLDVRTIPLYQYIVDNLEFLFLEVQNLYLILPNVILPASSLSIYPIWFRTRVIGNNIYSEANKVAKNTFGYCTQFVTVNHILVDLTKSCVMSIWRFYFYLSVHAEYIIRNQI